MSAGQARIAIAEKHLVDSQAALSSAAERSEAEPLSGRLCRVNDEWLYELTLLRRDGRVIYAVVDAMSGQVLRTRNSN